MPKGSDGVKPIARRLVLLDLIEGDRGAAATDLAVYRASGGQDLTIPEPPASGSDTTRKFIEIPGPLRSFARMAAISTDPAPDDVFPALARNVVTNGYQASRSNDVLEPTEYLKLVMRYVSQARELEKLAGPGKVIKIDRPASQPKPASLLRIVGFRMRGGCGSDVVLETVNAARAFLTTDSGFPMAELEQALRTGRPFTYDYHPTLVPVLYGPDYWVTPRSKGLVGSWMRCSPTRRFAASTWEWPSSIAPRPISSAQRTGAAAPRLMPTCSISSEACSRSATGAQWFRAVRRSAAAWGELVGATPEKGPQFFDKLLAKDDGWLASLYDSLARIHGPVQAYLTDPARMEAFYARCAESLTSPGPARPVFRANADMMLLTTRLRLDADGRPHIPGGIDVWRDLFLEHPHGKYDAKLTRAATSWRSTRRCARSAVRAFPQVGGERAAEDLHGDERSGPLPRQRRYKADTVEMLARGYRDYGAQYRDSHDSPDGVRRNYRAFSRRDGSGREDKGSAAACGYRRKLAGLGRPVADSLPAGRRAGS